MNLKKSNAFVESSSEELKPGFAYFGDPPMFPCTCFPNDTWNGAAKPFFTREILGEVLKYLNAIILEESGFELTFKLPHDDDVLPESVADYSEEVYCATKMAHGIGWNITPTLMFNFDELEVTKD